MTNRCIAIEEEVKNTPKPHRYRPSICLEGDSDEYQERLEYYWWKDALQAELDALRIQLGLKRKLLIK